MQLTMNFFPTSVAIVLLGALAAFMLRQKDIPGARALSFCMFSTMTATTIVLVAVSAKDQEFAVAILKWFNLFGSCFALSGYFLMIAQFAGNRFFSRPSVIIVYASVLFMAFFFAQTGSYYHFDYRIETFNGWRIVRFGNGPWFIVDQMFLFASTGCSLFILIKSLYDSKRKQFASTALLIFAAILPYIETFVVLNSHLAGIPKINYSFFTFIVADLIGIVALLLTRGDELIPIARGVVIESMQDIMLTLNPDNIIMDASNTAVAALGGDRKNIIGRDGGGMMSGWVGIPRLLQDGLAGTRKISVQTALGSKTYILSFNPINDDNGVILGRLLMLHDITEVEQREEIERHNHQLKLLSQEVISALEKERDRIGRELHDELGNRFLSLSMRIETLKIKKDIPDQEIEPVENIIQDISNEIMRIYKGLKPTIISRLGLSAALESLAREAAGQGLKITTEIAPVGKNDMAFETALGIYRIAQESITNIIKHADSGNVRIELKSVERGIELCINDDGKGMSVSDHKSHSGIGLIGMKERAETLGGTFELHSVPGVGTAITVFIPLVNKHPEAGA